MAFWRKAGNCTVPIWMQEGGQNIILSRWFSQTLKWQVHSQSLAVPAKRDHWPLTASAALWAVWYEWELSLWGKSDGLTQPTSLNLVNSRSWQGLTWKGTLLCTHSLDGHNFQQRGGNVSRATATAVIPCHECSCISHTGELVLFWNMSVLGMMILWYNCYCLCKIVHKQELKLCAHSLISDLFWYGVILHLTHMRPMEICPL